MKRQTRTALLIACGVALTALVGCTRSEIESVQAVGIDVTPMDEQQAQTETVILGVYTEEEIG